MLLNVGQITRPHGIRGEVVVFPRTDEPAARFAAGSVLFTQPPPAPPEPGAWRVPDRLTVEEARAHQGRLIVLFDGVYDRNVAEALRGTVLCVDAATVPAPADPDEFNDHQLVGLAAIAPDGTPLGEVTRIDHAPAADLLVLRLPDGRTGLVPFVKAIVPAVDVAAGTVTVDAPEGLFDL